MPTNSIHNNGRLPFDILGTIFEECSILESEKDPLEKLLLVCRSWSLAARGHRSIWRRIKITIGHEPTFSSCFLYAVCRLSLSGSSIPLEIELDSVVHATNHPVSGENSTEVDYRYCCRIEAIGFAEHILGVLAGPNGEGCKRWTSLTLTPAKRYFDVPRSYSFAALRHPVPMLQTVKIHDLDFIGDLFPKCPSLLHIELRNVFTIPPIDLSNTRSIRLTWYWEQPVDLLNLISAPQLESLDLWVCGPGMVINSSALPSVRSLSIGGTRFPLGLTLQLPGLQTLLVNSERFEDVEVVIGMPGIPFSQIKRLKIQWSRPKIEHNIELQNALWTLLSKCTAVEMVELDSLAFIMLFKLMCQRINQGEGSQSGTSISPWSNHKVKVDVTMHSKYFRLSISGREGAKNLARYMKKVGAPDIDASWEEIWKCVA